MLLSQDKKAGLHHDPERWTGGGVVLLRQERDGVVQGELGLPAHGEQLQLLAELWAPRPTLDQGCCKSFFSARAVEDGRGGD